MLSVRKAPQSEGVPPSIPNGGMTQNDLSRSVEVSPLISELDVLRLPKEQILRRQSDPSRSLRLARRKSGSQQGQPKSCQQTLA